MTKALATSNEFIARDEGLHCGFSIQLYKHLIFKLKPERIQEIFKSAVELEIEFITESLPCRLIGMSSELMIQHIQSVADFRLSQYGVPLLYNVKTPFSFMDALALDGKTNFFERRVSEYAKSNGIADKKFSISDEF